MLTWFGMCFGYPGERAFGDWSTQGELTEIEGAVHSWAVVVSRVLERNVMLNYSLGCFLRPGEDIFASLSRSTQNLVQGRYSENFFILIFLSKYIYANFTFVKRMTGTH